MRIFIQHVDSYVGKALLKELRKYQKIYNRIFGSLKDVKGEKPAIVKRVVSRVDEKPRQKYSETLRLCKFVFFALHNDAYDEIDFALEQLKKGEENVTFVLISSLFVWGSGEDINGDGDLGARDCAPAFKKWKEYEEKVLGLNQEGSNLKGHVIGAGAFYGGGECANFETIFKEAWLGKTINLPIASKRSNRVPTVNVYDCARLCKKLAYEVGEYDKPYLVCCEPKQHDLTTLWQAIVAEMTVNYPIKGEPPEDVNLIDDEAIGATDQSCTPTSLMLEDYTWVAPGGMTKNIRAAGEEYTKKNNLQPVNVLILRNPCKDPQDQRVYDAAVGKFSEYLQGDFNITQIPNVSAIEKTNTTRYRGYVLDQNLDYGACLKNFTTVVKEEKVIEIEEGGDDDSPGGQNTRVEVREKTVPKPSCPTHCIALHWPEGENTAFEFFREFTNTSPFYMVPKGTPDEVEVQVESIRIYMDGMNIRPDGSVGRPKNFGIKTEAECIEETLKLHEEAAKRAEEEGGGTKDSAVNDDNLNEIRKKETKAEKNRWEKLQQLAEREEELQAMSMTTFLQDNVIPTLTEGLILICKLRPEGPIDYLANFLENSCAEKN